MFASQRSVVWALALLLGCGADPSGPPVDACIGIAGTVEADGVSIRRPTQDPVACREMPKPMATQGELTCEKRAPDLSCLSVPSPRGTPLTVTLRACVDVFGIGATSYGLSVTVLPAQKADGSVADPGYDLAGPPGQQINRSTPFGRALSTEVLASDCKDLGYVEVPNVPTETDLVARVTDEHVPKERRGFVDAYQYGLLLRNSAVTDAAGAPVADPAVTCATSPCFVSETVNAIQRATTKTISLAAGVSVVSGEDNAFDGVGQGYIAGEVQDCSSDDRLQNAVVAVAAQSRRLSYFSIGFDSSVGSLDDPKPSSTRTMTNADGLYVAIGVDTMPGGVPVTVGAAISPSVCGADGICPCNGEAKNLAWTAADAGEGETKVLGTRRVYVFPDSVTIMTFDRNLYTTP